MISVPYGSSGAFSLISWLLFTQFGHDISQFEAEYASYLMISFILFLIGNLEI